MPADLKIGIIGGSGMEDPAFISDFKSKDVSTPYGDPSSKLILGTIEDVPVVIPLGMGLGIQSILQMSITGQTSGH